MKITNKDVKKWLKAIRSEQLYEMVENYPEDELDGRSEIQLFADELSYAISCYEEDGHVWRDDLEDAREILQVTKYGKSIPINMRTFKPVYRPSEIQIAKDTVNEYRRMKYRYQKLKESGIYGRWL